MELLLLKLLSSYLRGLSLDFDFLVRFSYVHGAKFWDENWFLKNPSGENNWWNLKNV